MRPSRRDSSASLSAAIFNLFNIKSFHDRAKRRDHNSRSSLWPGLQPLDLSLCRVHFYHSSKTISFGLELRLRDPIESSGVSS